MDALGDTTTARLIGLIFGVYASAAEEVCGGFYVDNFDAETMADVEMSNLYANVQVRTHTRTSIACM